jgi:hypothetical protein
MKITELLIESEQLHEGPILNKIGSAIGSVAGTAAKGVGALAGGVAGMKTAAKKGFQSGKKQVSKAGDKTAARTAPGQTVPTQPAGDSATMQGVKSGLNKALGAQAFTVNPNVPSAQGLAQTSGGNPQTAPQPTAAATAPASQPSTTADQSLYMKVKADISKLDKKGKQRIMSMLQKELGSAPAAQPKAAPVAAPARSARTGNKKIQTTGSGKPTAKKVQTAGKENKGNMVSESFTLFRKH